MRRPMTAATTTALAACTAVVVTATPASAATGYADLAAYRLPSTATSQCVIGVTNNGPDTAFVVLLGDFLHSGLNRTVGELAAGQSTAVEYTGSCTSESLSQLITVTARSDGAGAPSDPNPLNNLVVFPVAGTSGQTSPFGS